MAVKKREVAESSGQFNLAALAQYITVLQDQANYLTKYQDLVKDCADIIKCLARTPFAEPSLEEVANIEIVSSYLVQIATSVEKEVRHDLNNKVVEKFYSYISEPGTNASPAICVMLSIFDTTRGAEEMRAAAQLMVQKAELSLAAGHEELRSALNCLYRWLSSCHVSFSTHLGQWLLIFVKELEVKNQKPLLVEVSLQFIEKMMQQLGSASTVTQAMANVIFHVVSCMREVPETLDKIHPHVEPVLTSLAAESGQWSRQLLQNLVDIVNSIINVQRGRGAAVNFVKYADLITCLERHMGWRSLQYTSLQPWTPEPRSSAREPGNLNGNRVGLANGGNTCYMNSVFQALLATRRFSNYVMLNKFKTPYWSGMACMFATMVFSATRVIDPTKLLHQMRLPQFSNDNQHDSSEFMGFLFELLMEHEHATAQTSEVSNRSACGTDFRFLFELLMEHEHATAQTSEVSKRSDMNRAGGPVSNESSPGREIVNNGAGSSKRRSVSPTPGGSNAGTSSGGKRPASFDVDLKAMTPKKRNRQTPQCTLNRNSIIDQLFAGVLLTRVECVLCKGASIRRDVFRELQLSFPENVNTKTYSIEGLLRYYFSVEQLSGENKYNCSHCKRLTEAEKTVMIKTFPTYLILVLKNFKYDPSSRVLTKLLLSVDYDDTVTLPGRGPTDRMKYKLYAAIIHSGTSLDAGHYYTNVKEEDQWYEYNDEHVESVKQPLNSLCGVKTPYVLFYRRLDLKEMSVPRFQELPEELRNYVQAHNKRYAVHA